MTQWLKTDVANDICMNSIKLEISSVGAHVSLEKLCLQVFLCCLGAKGPPIVTEPQAWNVAGHEDSNKVTLSPSLQGTCYSRWMNAANANLLDGQSQIKTVGLWEGECILILALACWESPPFPHMSLWFLTTVWVQVQTWKKNQNLQGRQTLDVTAVL